MASSVVYRLSFVCNRSLLMTLDQFPAFIAPNVWLPILGALPQWETVYLRCFATQSSLASFHPGITSPEVAPFFGPVLEIYNTLCDGPDRQSQTLFTYGIIFKLIIPTPGYYFLFKPRVKPYNGYTSLTNPRLRRVGDISFWEPHERANFGDEPTSPQTCPNHHYWNLLLLLRHCRK